MRSFSGLITRFRKDQRGNIVVIFGIAIIPLLPFMGAAIDYSRATRAKTTMQSVLDSVSLMVAKDLSSGLITTSQINSKALTYFSALYTDVEANSVSVSATYTVGSGNTGSTIQVNGSAKINTAFMQIVGFNTKDFSTSAT